MTDNIKESILKCSVLDRLLEYAAKGGVKVEPIRMMHRLIDFSDPPVGYIRRLRTLSKIAALKIGDKKVYPQLEPWTPYIDQVLKTPNEFAEAVKLPPPEKRCFLAESGTDPLYHRSSGMTRHSLEALLWVGPPGAASEKTKHILLLLQAHMMFAQIAILEVEYRSAENRGDASPGEEIFHSLYGPCMLARKLAKNDWGKALPYLPFIKDRAEYVNALDSLRSAPPGIINEELKEIPADKLDKALAGISSFVRRGANQKVYQKRAFYGRESNGVGNRSTSPPPPEDPFGSDDHHHAVDFEFTRTKGTPARRKELDQSGEAPEDHISSRTFILTDGGEVAAAHILAAKARENQLLPRRYREPQPREYALLIEGMYAHPEHFGTPIEAKEVIAWTEFVFFQSCLPEQATELFVGSPTTPPEDCDFMLRIAEDPADDGLFPPRVRVRAIEPPYESEYVPVQGERPRVNHFEIPDLGGVCASVRELLCELRKKGNRPEASAEAVRARALRIFSQDAGTYIGHVNGFAVSIGLGDRVRISGLGKVLFQRYVEISDIVSAALIACSEPKLASVRRWYFTPEVEALRRVHQLGTESVCAELSAVNARRHPAVLEKSTEYAGSRRCAEFGYIKQLVGFLQSIVAESCAVRSPRQRREAFTRRHNALTMLAVWVVDLSVGMRSTQHPYFHASEYDCETGMGSLADKGQEKARPYCLSRLTMDIAAEYDKYLNQLVTYGLPSPTRDLPCYFIRLEHERLVAVPVTPASIEDYIGGTFRFAPNWARRMVKTLAIEQGIPAIYTDAYCGHSNYGQEQYYTFSSFDPLPYFESMRNFLEQLLKDLGFKPLTFDPSFLEPRR